MDEYATLSTITGTASSPGQMVSMKHRFTVPGAVKGIRVFLPAGGTPTTGYEVHLFDNIGAVLMASKDAPAFTPGTWNTVLFDNPVEVLTAHTYHAAYWTPSGTNNIGRDPGAFGTFVAETSGNVKVLGSGEDGPQGSYHGIRDTMPNSSYAGVGVAAIFSAFVITNIVPGRMEGVVDDSVGTTLVTIDHIAVIATTLAVSSVEAVPTIGQIWPQGSG